MIHEQIPQIVVMTKLAGFLLKYKKIFLVSGTLFVHFPGLWSKNVSFYEFSRFFSYKSTKDSIILVTFATYNEI